MTDLSELNQTGVHHTVDISATVNGRKVSEGADSLSCDRFRARRIKTYGQ